MNECQTDAHGCHHRCKNAEGSYTCSCHPGFTLDADGLSCSSKSCFILRKGLGKRCYCCDTEGTFRREVKLVLNPSTVGVQKINMT